MFVDNPSTDALRTMHAGADARLFGHGRFLQVDPVGYKEALNLYAYVADDPMNHTDPTGQYQCQGSAAQCGAVATAYNRASEALKGGDLSKGERIKLQGSLNALGAPGAKNGVTVSFATSKEIAAKAGGRL